MKKKLSEAKRKPARKRKPDPELARLLEIRFTLRGMRETLRNLEEGIRNHAKFYAQTRAKFLKNRPPKRPPKEDFNQAAFRAVQETIEQSES
jgi:hypothetical protein